MSLHLAPEVAAQLEAQRLQEMRSLADMRLLAESRPATVGEVDRLRDEMRETLHKIMTRIDEIDAKLDKVVGILQGNQGR